MIQKAKPITSSLRQRFFLKKNNLDNITLKSKKIGKIKKNGRNNQGKITVQYRGGGHKQSYRLIDFNRQKSQIKGTVESILYDPNRSAYIAGILIKYNSILTQIEYILAPEGIKKNKYIESSENASLEIGNALPLKNIPIGSLIHNLNFKENEKSKYIRSAGTFAQLIQKIKNDYAKIRLSSGELRLIPLNCYATLGIVSNINHKKESISKAGRSRWLNKRPHVRGVAKNPIDHPHGGGEGKTSGGRPSVTPKGIITKGKPTRNKKKKNKLILNLK